MDHEIRSLTKRELVDAIAWEVGITQAKASPVVHATIEKIADALARRRRVELRGLGVFEVVERRGRWTTNPNDQNDLRIPARYTVRFKPSKVLKPYHQIGASMSLNARKMVKPEAALTFSSEKVARRFASLALSKFPRAEVTCAGRKVRVKHGHRDAEGVYALAQRVHRRPKEPRVAMSGPPPFQNAAAGPPEKDEPKTIKVYFKKLENAQRAVETFNKIGSKAKSDEDDYTNPARGHTVTIAGGDRAQVNRVIAELKGSLMPPDPTPVKGFAFAMGDRGRITSDWRVSFTARSQKLTAAVVSAMKQKGAHVTQAGKTAVIFHRMTYDEVKSLLTSVNIPGGDIDEKRYGNKPVRPLDHMIGDIVQIGGTHVEDPLKDTTYADPKAGVGDVFKQLAVDVSAEVGTQKAMDLLRRIGVDLAVIGGGYLAIAFREALARAVHQWLTQVGGRVVKQATSKGKPSTSALRSMLSGLGKSSKSNRDDSAARAQAIRQGRQYEPPEKGGGGFLRSLFGGGKAKQQTPPPLSSGGAPQRSQAPQVQPPPDKKGYRPVGKNSRNKGTFSFEFKFEDDQDTCAGAAAPAGASMGVDYVGIAYAVMDFLSSEATRMVADKLVEAGVRVTKSGATKLIATIKDGDQLDKIRSIAARARGSVKLRRITRSGGGQSKSASFGFGDTIRKVLSKRGPTGEYKLRAGVIPGAAVLIFASAIAAQEALTALQRRGIKAIQKGVRLIVKKPAEEAGMGFAGNEIIKRPKWRKVDSPEDRAWWKYEQQRRKYAQGRGPRPSSYGSGAQKVDDFSPGQFGLMLVTLAASYPVQVALLVALQKAGIAARHVGDKILAKAMGLKQMKDLKKIAAAKGAKVENVEEADKGASMAFPWKQAGRALIRSPAVWVAVGASAIQFANRVAELGVKVRKQNKMLAEIDVNDPEQLRKVADIAKEERVTLKKKLDETAESQPLTEKVAKVGRYAAIPVLLGAVAFFKYKDISAAMHDLAQLGVRGLRAAADRAGRGKVTITQLSPEQLASIKQVVNKYGGKLQTKRIGASASMGFSLDAVTAQPLYSDEKTFEKTILPTSAMTIVTR